MLCIFFINRHILPVAAVTEDTISEKLQEQESRQAELNHYVKMVNASIEILKFYMFFLQNCFYFIDSLQLLQRSPGDQHYEVILKHY